jgi:glycosyltransferase involved in cell wall biosynthesis
MFYSIIIPVYNRPEEVEELLRSVAEQTFRGFEVLVVEDGSSLTCEEVANRYADDFPLRYFYKPNSGPGRSRNYGAAYASGDYLIFLDSDCILPPDYLQQVERYLGIEPVDAFGGPDRSHPSFTVIQKGISYSMTAFLTTGGIRGGGKKLDRFYPRSFNMGIHRMLFQQLSGFSAMRFGEDIDFSIRIYQAGCRCRLFPDAWVYHKRRTDFKKFFKQVHNSGIARINLYKKYPASLKLVHLLPALFTLAVAVLLLGTLVCLYSPLPLLVYALLLFVDASLRCRNVAVGGCAVVASFVQLIGYGSGFLRAWWRRCVWSKREFSAFNRNFYG